MSQGNLKTNMAVDDRNSEATPGNVTALPSADSGQNLRIVEALLFAAAKPVSLDDLASRLPAGTDVDTVLRELADHYEGRGVNLVRIAGKWMFRTSDDLSFLLRRDAVEQKRLSRAALETLAIIAYHQPTTRADIEEIRGVSTSKGTLDALMEIGWIKMRGRRQTPGRPVTYGTTEEFLSHFGLAELGDLPGLAELKGAGFLTSNLPAGFTVPEPNGMPTADSDEDLLTADDPLGPDVLIDPLSEMDRAPDEM